MQAFELPRAALVRTGSHPTRTGGGKGRGRGGATQTSASARGGFRGGRDKTEEERFYDARDKHWPGTVLFSRHSVGLYKLNPVEP
jgi:hypothetical protein